MHAACPFRIFVVFRGMIVRRLMTVESVIHVKTVEVCSFSLRLPLFAGWVLHADVGLDAGRKMTSK